MGNLENIFEFIIPIFLYAEIHSKLPPIPNILNNKLPEILADAPQRIDKNSKLPLLILIKDSHLYPLELLSIRLRIKQEEKKILEVDLWEGPLRLAQRLWYRLFEIDPGTEGWIKIDVVFTIKNKNKTFTLKNNSYRAIKNKSLNVYVSSEALPDSNRILYGDVHYHSFFTEDVVEFGAPIDVTAKMAQAMGLSFLAVTDHSYDLDDEVSNPMTNDPFLQKWENFLTECSSIEAKGVTVLPGIEVSAGNKKRKNVHLTKF